MSDQTFTTEARVGLQERELRFWIESLRGRDRRSRLRVADELERATNAALKAGLVIPGQRLSLSPVVEEATT